MNILLAILMMSVLAYWMSVVGEEFDDDIPFEEPEPSNFDVPDDVG